MNIKVLTVFLSSCMPEKGTKTTDVLTDKVGFHKNINKYK